MTVMTITVFILGKGIGRMNIYWMSPTLMHKSNFKTVIVITVIEQHFEMEISCQNQSVPFRVLLGAEHLQECYFLCTFAAANQS